MNKSAVRIQFVADNVLTAEVIVEPHMVNETYHRYIFLKNERNKPMGGVLTSLASMKRIPDNEVGSYIQ